MWRRPPARRRLAPTPGKTEADMAAAIAGRPAGLKCTFNLGVADFYPAAAGKEGAAAHLLARWGGAPAGAAHLCDDDNDLPLAAMVGRAFLPSITEVGGRGVGARGGRGTGWREGGFAA
jgi:3-deoxy-D-manno-octulosonate 8-phosphate phosphatase KdsC-like HAD superfamily phosphatase